jgi:protein-S-isoprenylcysteine O-methyltransferase Ste14
MGSIIRYDRPLIHHPRAKNAVDRETREARRSLFILIGSFFVTATVMCGAVVAMVSSTWTDVIIMSAFVLVFALLKIMLANALIYTMLRYDAATTDVPARAGAVRSYRRLAPIRQAPAVKIRERGSLKISRLRAATGNSQQDCPRP